MKQLLPGLKILILSLLFISINLQAQSGSSLTGVVTWASPTEIKVKAPGGTDPVSIAYGSGTTLVDEKGAPVPPAALTTGQHVVVSYDLQGNSMTANRIVVKKVVGAKYD